jgi:hypothetical protein
MTQVLARPIIETSTRNFVVMTSSVRRVIRISNEDRSRRQRLAHIHKPFGSVRNRLVKLRVNTQRPTSNIERRTIQAAVRTVGYRFFS